MTKRRKRLRTTPPPSLPTIKCEVPGCESETTSTRFLADGWYEVTTNQGPKHFLLRACLCGKHFPDTFKEGKELALAIAMGFALKSPLDDMEEQDEH